jgi:hypothetical protein
LADRTGADAARGWRASNRTYRDQDNRRSHSRRSALPDRQPGTLYEADRRRPAGVPDRPRRTFTQRLADGASRWNYGGCRERAGGPA